MGRTPKYFDGTARTTKTLAELLPDALNGIRNRSGNQGDEIFSFWSEVIGGKMGPLTEPVSFVDEVLTVKVKSSTLYSLLCQHERGRLLKELQKKFTIRNIVFRIG